MTATTAELHAYLAADTTPAPRKHVYGPGCWCRPSTEEVPGAWADTYDTVLVHRDVDAVAEEARHADTVRSLVVSVQATVEAVRERDEARAALARVRALADEWARMRGMVMWDLAATSVHAALDGSAP